MFHFEFIVCLLCERHTHTKIASKLNIFFTFPSNFCPWQTTFTETFEKCYKCVIKNGTHVSSTLLFHWRLVCLCYKMWLPHHVGDDNLLPRTRHEERTSAFFKLFSLRLSLKWSYFIILRCQRFPFNKKVCVCLCVCEWNTIFFWSKKFFLLFS